MILGDVVHSYRTTATLINRVRYQPMEGTPYRTLQANTEKEGTEVIDYMGKKTSDILKRHGFSEDGTYLGKPEDYGLIQPDTLPKSLVEKAATDHGGDYLPEDLINNRVCFEDPSRTVSIAIDDVSVKKQREERREAQIKSDDPQKHKYLHNTVARVDRGQRSYTLVGSGMKTTMRYLIAFLISNKLLGYRFQFFTDGHTVLNDTIRSCFKWYSNFGIILDWFHLVKKCKEQMSMALRGRIIRNEILKEVMPLLWYGLTDRAIVVLEQIDSAKVKDNETLLKLISYLTRNKDMIPCYAMRKRLGLKNSSAVGEKMNDLLVSSRQKHNGMSWSRPGSLALAALTGVKRNKEDQSWLDKKKLDFKLAA